MRMWFLRQTVLHPDTATSHHWEFFCILRKLWSRGTRVFKTSRGDNIFDTLCLMLTHKRLPLALSLGYWLGYLARLTMIPLLSLYNCGHHEHEHYRNFVQRQQCTLLVFLWNCEFELDWPQFLGSCDFRERTTCFLVLISTVLSTVCFHRLELKYLAWSTTDWNWEQPQFLGSVQFHTLKACSESETQTPCDPCVWLISIVLLKTVLSFVVLTRSLRLDFHCVLSWSFSTEYLSLINHRMELRSTKISWISAVLHN